MAKFSFEFGKLNRFRMTDDWQLLSVGRRELELDLYFPDHQIDDNNLNVLKQFMTNEHSGKRLRITIETVED